MPHDSSLFLFPATFQSAREFLITNSNSMTRNKSPNLLMSENVSVQNHSDDNDSQVPSELNKAFIVHDSNSVNEQENPQNQRCQGNQNMRSKGIISIVKSKLLVNCIDKKISTCLNQENLQTHQGPLNKHGESRPTNLQNSNIEKADPIIGKNPNQNDSQRQIESQKQEQGVTGDSSPDRMISVHSKNFKELFEKAILKQSEQLIEELKKRAD